MNINNNQDSLDQQKQQYQRARSGHSQNNNQYNLHNQNQYMKQLYKQQLDDFVKQKQQQKRVQKQQDAKEKMLYNQRINHSMDAQKLKDVSYKNYYQVLLNNQANISKNYVNPFIDREIYKNQLISQRIQDQKKRSQAWHQLQQKRLFQAKKNYRQQLANQINQKYQKNTIQGQFKHHQNQQYKKLTHNPRDLAMYDRQKKLIEMQKYKQDLDRNVVRGSRVKERSITNNSSTNDFNTYKVEDRHNPMVNPLPFNIQNPYILKEMMKRQNPEVNQYSS